MWKDQRTAVLGSCATISRWRRISSRPVMILPMLYTKDVELAIWAGEALIHPPFDGTTMTPWIARNPTFAVSITVDCRIWGVKIMVFLSSQHNSHIERSPSIRKPAFAWNSSKPLRKYARPPTLFSVLANGHPEKKTRSRIRVEKTSYACDHYPCKCSCTYSDEMFFVHGSVQTSNILKWKWSENGLQQRWGAKHTANRKYSSCQWGEWWWTFRHFRIRLSIHYLLSILHENFHDQGLQWIIVTRLIVSNMEIEVPLTLFMMSHIVCISATLYGAVETLQVNESMSHQLIKTVEQTDCQWSPILLLNRIPSSSSDASLGKLRSL